VNLVVQGLFDDAGDAAVDYLFYAYGGYNPSITANTLMNMLIFVFISGSYLSDYIHLDLRSDRRWRMLAAPVSINQYVFSAMAAGMVFSFTSGLFVLGVSWLMFDVYFGNIGFVLLTLFVMTVLAQFIGMLLGLLAKNRSQSEALQHAIIWPMIILSGAFGNFNIPVIGDLFQNFSPFIVATRGIMYSTSIFNPDMGMAWRYLGILAGTAAILGIASVIAGRRKPL
jgi:ABC-type multidrug transport system permease subunit